jgi:hypothetical protein
MMTVTVTVVVVVPMPTARLRWCRGHGGDAGQANCA